MHEPDAGMREEDRRDLLRFITCGSVDDGKSTLIGRLLFDSRGLHQDQLQALAADSRAHGTQGGEVDYALLLDGLAAEREQGITIDVAYRQFATARRRFIVADCPGHEQYTRNMATGASTADLAVVLVDARKGVLAQTRRHSYLVSLLGIRQVVLAVNKMDLVGHDRAVFEAIAAEYAAVAARLGIEDVLAVPLSALRGDNLVARSAATPWYPGPPLLEYLETVDLPAQGRDGGLRLPVQWVNRPHQDFRGFAGTLVAGSVRAGDEVVVLPSGQRTRVARVLAAARARPPGATGAAGTPGAPGEGESGEVAVAGPGEAVTLTLADEIDVGRGDVIAAAGDAPEVSDQFAAHLLWMDEAPLLPGRPYWLKLGARTVAASVTEIKHRVDVDTQERLAAKRLELNEVALCNLSLGEPVAFAPYAESRALGGFILIDRQSHATAAAGTLDFALRRAANIRPQPIAVDPEARARLKGQQARVLWFTGLSGAGKSTIANRVEQRLHALGFHTFLLDGDNLRHGLNRDLGFTDEDRVENIRRAAEVARLMADAGLIVLASFISPFRAERRLARDRFAPGEFLEIFVDVPLAVAEARDPKGLYRRARAGRLPHFTGVDSPYEAPEAPELRLDTTAASVDELAARVLAQLGLT